MHASYLVGNISIIERRRGYANSRVIHIIVNRVDASTWAAVLVGWASRGSSRLRWGVRDLVAITGAATLENVVETEPMADFVRERLALVVVGRATAGEGRVEDDNTIVLGGTLVVRWESSIAQEALSISSLESNGVDVERGSITFAKRGLHVRLGLCTWADVGEPVGVGGAGRLGEGERDARGCVVLVHGVNVGLHHAVWDVSASDHVRLLNDVPDDRDWGRCQCGDVVD